MPQNTIQNLSVATGKILRGILFSKVWPTAADVPNKYHEVEVCSETNLRRFRELRMNHLVHSAVVD